MAANYRNPDGTPDLDSILRGPAERETAADAVRPARPDRKAKASKPAALPNDDELDALFAPPAPPAIELLADEQVDADEQLDTARNLERIHRWLAQGVSRKSVAAIFHFKLDEFEDECERLPRLGDTVRRAEGLGEKRAAAKLWEVIDGEDLKEAARNAQFFLKTKWAGAEKAVKVEVAAPAPEPEQSYSRDDLTRLLNPALHAQRTKEALAS